LPQALESIDPRLSAVQWRSADEIRALSMRIFDRSFAVTYALEAVALLVGLFGVAAACSSDALSRIREFGMLRHVGLPARAARTQLMMEAVLGTAVALLWGSLLGAAIGWVLIARVNPQSFHWTMQMHIPWSLLLGASVVLLAGAALSAYLASRPVVGRHPIHAIRQDT
ncbi:MAG: ABC transporter permease, partial [Burkholderiales bacterium]